MACHDGSIRHALVAGLALLALGSAGLGRADFSPEEARGLLAAQSTAPALARLPSLLAAALAAGVVAGGGARLDGRAGAGHMAVVAAGLSPGLLAAGRAAGPTALAALLLAVASLLAARQNDAVDRGRRAGAALLALVAVALAGGAGWPHLDFVPLRIALALWGAALGPNLPPWRPDVALPAGALLLVLGVRGAGRDFRSRLRALSLLLAAAAWIGLGAPRPGAAPLAGAALAPVIALWVARGSTWIGSRLPTLVPVGVYAALAWVGLGNDLGAVDVLDPARRVPWRETARMLSVLEAGDTVLVGAPRPFPRALEYHLGRASSASLQADTPPAELDRHDRVLVLGWGVIGGLGAPTSGLEESLTRSGLRLRGELGMGALEPGLSAWLPWLGIPTPAAHYLRIRRYER